MQYFLIPEIHSVLYFVAVNECALDTDNCTQICNDTDDGFRCDCHPGFQLLSDNITCVGSF